MAMLSGFLFFVPLNAVPEITCRQLFKRSLYICLFKENFNCAQFMHINSRDSVNANNRHTVALVMVVIFSHQKVKED